MRTVYNGEKCLYLDYVIDKLIALKFPAYLIQHPAKIL